jgi:hypothetical protein
MLILSEGCNQKQSGASNSTAGIVKNLRTTLLGTVDT